MVTAIFFFPEPAAQRWNFFDVDNPLQVKARIEEAVDESNRDRERDPSPKETND